MIDESEDDVLLPEEKANSKKRWEWFKAETELNIIYDELRVKGKKKILEAWLKRVTQSDIPRQQKIHQLHQEREKFGAKVDRIKNLYQEVYWHYKQYTEPEAKGKRARVRNKMKKQLNQPVRAIDQIDCEIAILNAQQRYEENMNRVNVRSPLQRPYQPIPLKIAELPLNLRRPSFGRLLSPPLPINPLHHPSICHIQSPPPTNNTLPCNFQPMILPSLLRNQFCSPYQFSSQPCTSQQRFAGTPPTQNDYLPHPKTPPRPYTPFLDAPGRSSPPSPLIEVRRPSVITSPPPNFNAKNSHTPIRIDEMYENLQNNAATEQQAEITNEKQTENVAEDQTNQQEKSNDEEAKRREKAMLIFSMRQHLINVSKLNAKIGEEMLMFSKNWTSLFKLPEPQN